MLFNPLINEISARHVQEVIDFEREQRISYYLRRRAMHNGIVTDPNEQDYDEELCKKFFPKGQTEKPSEYQERMKLWVPVGALIIKRLVSLVIKGGVKYKYEPLKDSDAQLAEDATQSFEADLQYNNWESLFPEIVENALAIGELSTWQNFRKFDTQTGQAFDNGGRIKLTVRYPWIAEPIVNPDNVTEIIGSVAVYHLDNQVLTPAVSAKMRLDGSSKRIIELWLSALYDSETGLKKFPGSFTKFENERQVGDKLWSEMNFYGIDPTVFWVGPDADETQYRGKSYQDRFAELQIKLSRIASLELSGVQYLINQWYAIAADDAMPKQVEFRHNLMVKMGQGTPESRLGQTQRFLDTTEERELIKFLVNMIGQIAGYSPELLSGLEGSIGKAADSGIAMKILYEATEDAVRIIRASLTPKVKELMTKTIIVKSYENQKSFKIDTTKIRPVVTWDENIIPIDDKVQLDYDLLLEERGLRSRVDNVMKYNTSIATREQAEKFIQELEAAKPKPITVSPMRIRDKNAGQATQ